MHPDIVPELCTLCPDLLEDLLDGMLWHSASVEKGKVRYCLGIVAVTLKSQIQV